MPNRTRLRIGVSVAPDVMDILNAYGRAEKLRVCRACLGTGKDLSFDSSATAPPCPACKGTMHDPDARPTRTEIIEEAVREWRQRRLPKAADLLGSDPDLTGDESTDDYIDRIRGHKSVNRRKA